jgi:hypothetical protein
MNLFVPYNLSILVRDKGFVPDKAGAYQTQENNRLIVHWYNKRDFEIAPHLVPAPTYQQVVDWFREKHKIVIEVCYSGSMDNYCAKNIKLCGQWNFAEISKGNMWTSKNYYEALTKAIEEALKLI